MRRKEIFFKRLNFIFVVVLIVSFVASKEIPLPLQSEVSYSISGYPFNFTRFKIRQFKNNIQIILFSNNWDEGYWYDWGGAIREGIIPIYDYKNFWNSLYSLKFWKLKDRYGPNYMATDMRGGHISVSYEKEENDTINKSIVYEEPEDCAEEFKKVYELFQDMKKFAIAPPELNELLKNSEEWGEVLVNSEISRIKNPIYLDTLINLLSPENKYANGIIQALGNIGDKRAIPSLHQFLEKSMKLTQSYFPLFPPYRSYKSLIIVTFGSLAAIRDTQSIQLLEEYLNDKYDYWYRGQVSIQLALTKNYSGIPMLMDFLIDSRYSDSGNIFIRRIYDKNKGVVSAIIEALAKESEREILHDRKIIAIMKVLTDLTGQDYPYHQYLLYETKKETINKWIDWWEANKDKFK